MSPHVDPPPSPRPRRRATDKEDGTSELDEVFNAVKTLRRYGASVVVLVLTMGGGTWAALAQTPAKVTALELRVAQLEQDRAYTRCYVRSQVERTDATACRFLDPEKRP